MRTNAPFVGAGDIMTTATGRATAPVPRIDLGSNRKASNTVVRLNQWLIREVLAELESRGASQMEIRLSGALSADPRRLTQAEIDGFNLILWG